MAPFPSFTGPPAEPKTIRIPTFRSPIAKTQPAPVPQNRDEARAARLKTSGEGQWASLDALASTGPSSLAHLLAKRDPSTSRPTASSSSSRPQPIPEPTKKAAVTRTSPRKSTVKGTVPRTAESSRATVDDGSDAAAYSKATKRVPRASAFSKRPATAAEATTVAPATPDNDGPAHPPPPTPAASASAATTKRRKSSTKPKKDVLSGQAEADDGGTAQRKKTLKRKSAAATAVEGEERVEKGERPSKKRRSIVKGKGKAKEVKAGLDEEIDEADEPSASAARKARHSSAKNSGTATSAAMRRQQKEPKSRRNPQVVESRAVTPPAPSPPDGSPPATASGASAPQKKRIRESATQANGLADESEERKPKRARKSAVETASKVGDGKAKSTGEKKAAMEEASGKADEATRALKQKRDKSTVVATGKAAKRNTAPSAAPASTSRKQPVASTSRQPARQHRSPTAETSDDDDDASDGGTSKKKGVKVRTERLKGNQGKLNVFDVVAGGTRRVLDQLIAEHGKNARTLKLLQRFAQNVQSPLLSRSALLSTLTTDTLTLASARTRSKKLRLELVETQRARGEVERELRRVEEDWAREENEAETINSTHDFLASLRGASASWR